MAKSLSKGQTVGFEEVLICNMIEIQAVAQLLMEKGIITEQEYFRKIKLVQQEYKHLRSS